MKRFFYPLLLLLAVAFTFTACDDDDVIVPVLELNVPGLNESGVVEVAQGDTLVLKASVSNTEFCMFQWSLDGKLVATAQSYKFVSSEVGETLVSIKATSVSGGVATREFKVNVYGKYKNGTFILSEGNMSDENGRLAFISPKGVVTDSVYYKENGSFIGNVAQDLYIADGKMYIISQNGSVNGGDGFLVVTNAETMKKEVVYDKELESMSKTWPSHVAVVGDNAYIRDNNGINLFNLASKELKTIEGTAGATKNRMAVLGNKVFAAQQNNILVIENDKVVATIKLDGAISGVIKSSDNNLWVSCTTNPAQIVKVNATDYSVIQKNEITETGLNAGWGVSPAISAKGDTLYFSNNTTTIYRHIFSEKTTKKMVNVKDHVANANILYNNLAVHPETGDVYFPTLKGWGQDYKINDISVFNFDKAPFLRADYQGNTSFPAGIFFTANF